MTDPSPTLEVVGLGRRFSGLVAVDDVSVKIQGPGVTALIGPNGSGKSTMLALLTGFLRPTSGRVLVNGEDFTNKGPIKFARQGVRRTFQLGHLTPGLRTWEHIASGLNSRIGRSDRYRRVDLMADRLGLSDYLQSWPEALPPGIERKVQVAAALISDPPCLLLDEPGAGLSYAETADLRNAITEIGKTALVVVVEHNLEFTYELASRALLLVSGRIVADSSPELLPNLPIMREVYLGVASVSVSEEKEQTRGLNIVG